MMPQAKTLTFWLHLTGVALCIYILVWIISLAVEHFSLWIFSVPLVWLALMSPVVSGIYLYRHRRKFTRDSAWAVFYLAVLVIWFIIPDIT